MTIRQSAYLAASVAAILVACAVAEANKPVFISQRAYAGEVIEWIQKRDGSGDSIIYFECTDGTKREIVVKVKDLNKAKSSGTIIAAMDRECGRD